MGGSSRPTAVAVPQQSTTTNEPWSGAQPALNLAMSSAQNLFNQGPPQYYPGQTIAPFSAQTLAGMNGIQANAGTTAPWAQTMGASLTGMMAPPPTPGTGFAAGLANGGGFNPFMSAAAAAGARPNAGLGAIMPYATGQAGMNPFLGNILQASGQTASGIGTQTLQQAAGGGFLQNPFLSAAVGRATDAVRQSTDAMFSRGGRYGSSAHQDVLGKNVGDVASAMYGAAYDQDAGRMMGAAGQLSQYENAGLDRALQGVNAAAGVAEQGLGRMYDAATLMPAYFEQGAQRALSGFGAAGGMYQQGLDTGLNAFQTLGQDRSRTNADALAAIGAAPGVYDFANQGARDLMGVGQMLEGMDQSQIDADRARWDYAQNAPRANVEWLNAIATGQGQLGGTQNMQGVTYQPYQRSNPFLTGLGAAGAFASGLGALGGSAGLAGVLPFFSDRRLKSDIEPVGERAGIPIYRFRYLWDAPDVRHVGVMADEAPPEAVGVDPATGFATVDYAQIARRMGLAA